MKATLSQLFPGNLGRVEPFFTFAIHLHQVCVVFFRHLAQLGFHVIEQFAPGWKQRLVNVSTDTGADKWDHSPSGKFALQFVRNLGAGAVLGICHEAAKYKIMRKNGTTVLSIAYTLILFAETVCRPE